MGEHGLWWKNCVFEYAARVPLIVSWPKRFRSGQRRQGACALVDVVQTIAER
jgi:choline-sulfatase